MIAEYTPTVQKFHNPHFDFRSFNRFRIRACCLSLRHQVVIAAWEFFSASFEMFAACPCPPFGITRPLSFILLRRVLNVFASTLWANNSSPVPTWPSGSRDTSKNLPLGTWSAQTARCSVGDGVQRCEESQLRYDSHPESTLHSQASKRLDACLIRTVGTWIRCPVLLRLDVCAATNRLIREGALGFLWLVDGWDFFEIGLTVR